MRFWRLKQALEKTAVSSALVLREGAFPSSKINSRVLQKLYELQKRLVGTKIVKPEELPVDFKGDVLDLSMKSHPISTHGNVIAPRSLTGLNSKVIEARELSKAMPESFPRTISDLVKELQKAGINPSDTKAVNSFIQERVGPVWLFKPEYGARQNVNMFPTTVEQLQKENYPVGIVQERKTLQKKNPVLHGIDSVLSKMFNLQNTNIASIGRTKEYRVHVIRGKVVPNGTILRSSLLGSAVPIETSTTKKINNFVQRALDEAGKRGLSRLQKGLLGVDVGIDSRGSPFIIELNPAQVVKDFGKKEYVGTSGFLDNPLIADAVTKTAFGKMPFMTKAEIAAKTGLVGTAGLGTAAYLGSDRNNKKNVV